ncbi:hypothetical protein JTB14_019494 [Gonioctena quinquepunctata]|nr:hypothetical protein JTB14_019494 [Gonioctena quinquepunctata]
MNKLTNETSYNSNMKILDNNHEISNPKIIAYTFDDFFTRAPTNVVQSITKLENFDFSGENDMNSIVLIPFSEGEMRKIVCELKNEIWAGSDEIHSAGVFHTHPDQ